MINTDNIEILSPKWKDNYVAIAMSSSDEYIPYLSVCLQSLVDNSSINNKYDIIIFSSAPESCRKQLIIDAYTRENISIRFYNPRKILDNVKLNITHSYFNEACYYRIAASEVLSEYQKIIFTDIDLIFKGDINELAQIDIGNAPIAACKEPIWEQFIQKKVKICGQNIVDYTNNTLKLKDINTYYNTGVLVINVKKFKENNYFEKLKQLINENVFIYQEQCALNKLLNHLTFKLDPIWNCEISPRFDSNILSAKIVHFLGGEKPWKNPDKKYTYIWWYYARRTPFYEILIQRLVLQLPSIKLPFNQEEISCAFAYRRNIFTYWRCNLLSKITFGAKKLHYLKKKDMVKNKISMGKNIRNI